MLITQRGILAPIQGAEFDFNPFASELAANQALSGTVAQLASIDFGTLEVGQILVLEQYMEVIDTLGEGPVNIDMSLTQTGTAVMQFLRGNINRMRADGSVPLNGLALLTITSVVRVTTGGTKTLNLFGVLSAGAGPTGVQAVGLRTGLAAWVI